MRCRWAFLAHEEQALAGSQVSTTLELPAGARPGQRTVSLFQLYKLATRVAPKSNDRAYLQLWLGYARHQGYESPALCNPALVCLTLRLCHESTLSSCIA